MMLKVPNCHVTPQVSFYIRKGYSKLQVQQKLHGYPKHRFQVKPYKTNVKQNSVVPHCIPENEWIDEVFDEVIESVENNPTDEHPIELGDEDIIQEIDHGAVVSSWLERIKNARFTTKVLLILGILLIVLIVWFSIEIRNMIIGPDVQFLVTEIEYGDTDTKVFKVKDDIVYSATPLDVYSVGKQTVTIQYEVDGEIEEITETIQVVDTQAPKINYLSSSVSTTLGTPPDYKTMKLECVDPVDGGVSYTVEPVNVHRIGEHITTVTAEDIHGNTTTEQITVVVKGVGGPQTIEAYQKERKELEKAYKEKMRKEKEEKERKKLIESLGTVNLSESVLQWALDVHKINQEIWDTQYDAIVLAVIQVESGGTACDLMQSSEANGGNAPGHGCGVYKDEKESLRGGISALKNAFEKAGVKNATDYDAIAYALQGYNFGPRWYKEYDKYTRQNAKDFSEKMKKELNTNVYGAPGYPELVFKYYHNGIEIPEEPKDEPSEKPNDDNQNTETPPVENEEKPLPETPNGNEGNEEDGNTFPEIPDENTFPVIPNNQDESHNEQTLNQELKQIKTICIKNKKLERFSRKK